MWRGRLQSFWKLISGARGCAYSSTMESVMFEISLTPGKLQNFESTISIHISIQVPRLILCSEVIFLMGSDTHSPAVCILCLGKHPNPAKCTEKQTWDGKLTHCQHSSNGCLITSKNKSICMDFNFWRGCQQEGSHLHKCSGCSSSLHGANKCPQAQA